MPMTAADLKAFSVRYRTHAECIAVAAFACVAFAALGLAAKRKLAPARAEHASVSMVESEVSSFRSAFKPAPAGQDVARPPRKALASKRSTSKPASLRAVAAARPARPPPMMATLGTRVENPHFAQRDTHKATIARRHRDSGVYDAIRRHYDGMSQSYRMRKRCQWNGFPELAACTFSPDCAWSI